MKKQIKEEHQHITLSCKLCNSMWNNGFKEGRKQALEEVDKFLKERLFINDKTKTSLYRFMDFEWEDFKAQIKKEMEK